MQGQWCYHHDHQKLTIFSS